MAAGQKKNPVCEVVPPAFVAQEEEDGGAYDVTEMPKRFAHHYLEDKARVSSDRNRMHAIEPEDKWLTAQNMRVLSSTRALIRKLDAEATARDAAPAKKSAGRSP